MKYFSIILLFFALNIQAQTTYLKVADKPEYAKYQTWCKDSVWIDVIQWGKATVVNPNILGTDFQRYKAMYGDYHDKMLKDTVWYQLWRKGIKTAAISLTSDQVPLIRKVRIKTPRYELPSIAHYYSIRESYRTQW